MSLGDRETTANRNTEKRPENRTAMTSAWSLGSKCRSASVWDMVKRSRRNESGPPDQRTISEDTGMLQAPR